MTPTRTLVDATHEGSTATVTVRGDMDAASAPVVREAITNVEGEASVVVLDLQHVEFIDSTGLGVIAGASTRAAKNGHDFQLRRPTPSVRRTLQMFALDALVAE